MKDEKWIEDYISDFQQELTAHDRYSYTPKTDWFKGFCVGRSIAYMQIISCLEDFLAEDVAEEERDVN